MHSRGNRSKKGSQLRRLVALRCSDFRRRAAHLDHAEGKGKSLVRAYECIRHWGRFRQQIFLTRSRKEREEREEREEKSFLWLFRAFA